ncbi:glutamate synthase large subunit [Armatimonas sp.]|uniref:glutamate synthase large subunit n=1 Tax=Armatimonas sp. TaxID=1872638 RepID=UPI0037537A55
MDKRLAAGLYDPAFEHDACGVGFVAHIKGKRSHALVSMGLTILDNLVHRGATGCDPETGDGAGILLQVPDAFLRQKVAFALPAPGEYGVGVAFLPTERDARQQCERTLEALCRQEGQIFLGWRDVPVDSTKIGRQAAETEPVIRQFFIQRGTTTAFAAFSRKLYVIRKQVEREVAGATGIPDASRFYIPSLSTSTLIYKGLLLPHQMRGYYLDLSDPSMESAIALVHQRFSTNTFPSWPLAHPYRYIAHNGEINTIGGNRNWMKAREQGLTSSVLGDDLRKCYPLVSPTGSDSASLDNAVELMLMGGKTLAQTMMTLIPEAWDGNEIMAAERKAFYEYHACLMEPWDGPAAVAFTDGVQVGAVLDRNGLRPARYTVTTDDLVILASETGVVQVPPEKIVERGRLTPGKLFLVDTEQQRILSDEEVKSTVCGLHPYGEWLEKHKVELASLPEPPEPDHPVHAELIQKQRAFGYTTEELRLLLTPLAQSGEEALGSMGTDTPLAVLSHRPQNLFAYFKQLFAQVTNPPIDPIRESIVMSLWDYIGTDGSLLDDAPENARQIKIATPILSNAELEKLRVLSDDGNSIRLWTAHAIFRPDKPLGELERAVERLCRQASDALERGIGVIVLSDRNISPEYAPIPSLLAISAVHHHLIREGTRNKVALIVETGEAREVHHFACLVGFGASAINPYLVFETLDDLVLNGVLTSVNFKTASKNVIKGVNKGLLKVMSKMGISTLQSYRGAQIFEAIGINNEVIRRYFTGTASRLEGVNLEDIEREVRTLHESAFPKEQTAGAFDLEPGGQYQWRRYGEKHAISPDMVEKLQKSVREGHFDTFAEFSKAVNESAVEASTLRGLMSFRKLLPPVPLDEVEPAKELVKRFATGAMSLGSISRESHEGLAIAMNRMGGMSNTGEGGEDPARYTDERRSKIKQVASGRFGVTTHYLVNADELQIKMAQGAKPGEGGQLMGHKVDEYIGSIRRSTPGVTLISPPPHHDIYSIEDLAQLIFDLKNVNPAARISVKLVAEVGVGTVAAGVAKAHADHILISGYDGGTGASPLSSLKHAGVPWELGLAETQQVLVRNELRGRVRLQADGQLKTGRDVLVAALLGAEEFGFSTMPLVAQGCIMMRVCHLGTCPVGIATQDPALRAKFSGKPEHVINYFFFVAEEVRQLMAELGVRTLDELIGRTEYLETSEAVRYWKARGVDLSTILVGTPFAGAGVATRKVEEQDHGLTGALDYKLIEQAKAALEDARPVRFTMPIFNHNRTCGTMLSGEVAKRYGAAGLPDNTIKIDFTGSAGQSFGAFLAPGMQLTLVGDANDYVGKGMSGGRIIVHPPQETTFEASENIIAGNTLLYGATGGEAYLTGAVGERFCVRNSGAVAVVEGVGDHCCEYMTGGITVVLGRTGRNFAAGMSGGIAFVYDLKGGFPKRINQDLAAGCGPVTGNDVALIRELFPTNLPSILREAVSEDDAGVLRELIEAHVKYTGSKRGQAFLDHWEDELPKFVKVISPEYQRLLANRKAEKDLKALGDKR